jgi:hypothetical protein
MRDLSPKAQKAVFRSQARQHGREIWAEEGPRLHEGKVYVPSPYFLQEAKDFWRAQGFRFERASYSGQHEWVRDASLPRGDGQMFTAAAWLKAARRKYWEFFPQFKKEQE